jgi:hypothetical protein
MKKLKIFILCIIFICILNLNLIYTQANANEKYVVQAGVFQSQYNANKVYDLLIKNELPAYKEEKDKIWIYIGPYEDKLKANIALNNLPKLGIDGYVKKIIIRESNTTTNNSLEQNLYKVAGVTKEIEAKNYHLNEDITIDGIFGSHTFFVDINKYWEVKDNSYLELIFSQSQIKNYRNSTLTIEVNNSPIYSVLLYDKGVNKEKIRVPIPLDKIQQGFNEVKIKVYHRITDEPCTDIINPGNWIVFHKDSYVHIEFAEKNDSLSLKEYPYPYLKETNNNPLNNMIVIPDNFSSNEVNAAMVLAANFGQRYPYSKLDINISRFSEAVNKDKSNIIYIGNKDNTPKEILDLLSQEEINLSLNNALIKELGSPYNSNYKMLIILSNDKKSSQQAVKALSNDNNIAQMDKSYQFIPNILKMDEESPKESEYIYLKDMGYSNVKLEGIFYQKATFGVNIPKSWIVKEGSLLHIDMRYSEVLNFERSVLTVYLNDVPIGSKKLDYETANNDGFDIEIPKEVKENDYYNIKIVFYLELDSQDCNYRRDSNSWAYISNESYLYLPHEKRNDSFFENYESPFITDKRFNDLMIVVPRSPSSYEMSIVGSIASALGRNVNSLDDIEALIFDGDTNQFKDKNLIIIGTPIKNSIIKSMNDKLHIKFDKEFQRFISNERITLLDDYNNDLASLQLLKSPFDESKKALIITATKDQGLSWAKEFLTDFQLINELRGNAVIIGKSGNVQSNYYGIPDDKKEEKPIKEQEDKKKDIKKIISNKQIRNYIIFITAILCFIIVSSILIMRKKK